MRRSIMNRVVAAAAIVAALLLIGVVVTGAPSKPYRSTDKAFYADERAVNFVRPGLKFTITKVDIAADGTVRVNFKIADSVGMPLDRDGIVTPGTVSTSFVISRIPKDGDQYLAYTTRVQTSPITGKSATQAGTDAGGAYTKVADGEYVYTLGTKLPADFDKTATHSVLMYGARTLTEFDLGINRFDTVFTWVPSGAAVTKTRDIVRTATCNKCHVELGLHGGNRRSVEGCILCHQPQTTDPDTGNTVDFKVMIHKIHMGTSLPSNKDGGKYCIIGNAQSVNCWDKVNFPASPNNCSVCHDTAVAGAARPAQVEAHLKNPNRAACGSCHDNVNFETGKNHAGLAQISDNLCASCHIPQGELDFDASIMGSHVRPTLAPSLPGIVFAIESVDDGTAGKKPRVTFTVKDKKGAPIAPPDMTALSLILAGPTSDYASYVSETARAAQDLGGGRYAYTFNATIPAEARGSYTIGMEGYRNTMLVPGTTKEQMVRDAGVNVQKTFSVDGRPVEARRRVVATESCNGCHSFLSLHGGNRNRVEECVLCHNPNQTDTARRPAANNPPEGVNFALLVHRIHGGPRQTRDFTIFGFGGTANNFNEVGFPGILTNCASCHVNNSQRLPLRDNLQQVKDPRGYIPTVGPEAGACLGCHATKAAASHALANTTAIGESCAACHGPNAEFSVDRVHAR